jgi:hypothetical protein
MQRDAPSALLDSIEGLSHRMSREEPRWLAVQRHQRTSSLELKTDASAVERAGRQKKFNNDLQQELLGTALKI